MEGDGMVALVQGLRDAGLAVTLMNTAHLRDSLKSNLGPLSKSSVETSTVTRPRANTAAQIHDGHYTSSYQLAHCNVRPSSPPHHVPEFPIQRPAPYRNLSHFQANGYENEYALSPISYSSSGQAYRRAWDRDSASYLSPPVSSYQSTDPFVHSLRRYPQPLSPERSVSTELVQRLLNYTQNKHLSKNSNSRSLRSLREESPTKDKRTDTTSSKNIQTYTRTQGQSRDCGANTNNYINFNLAKKGQSFSSTSPYNVRNKRDYSNETYDYLKSSSRRLARHPEVRYLNDVRKCIRDTIKQIYDDEPRVCPQIKSRYSHHQRIHHSNISKEKCPVQSDQNQASTSTAIFSPCQPPIATQPDDEKCPKHRVCCFCKKPIPCACKPDPSQETSIPETLKQEEAPTNSEVTTKITKANSADSLCMEDDSQSGGKIADEVIKWLKALPVYADDSHDNKKKREEMIKDLVGKLQSLESDRNYQEKAKEEIKKCIEKLPIWYPGAKRDQVMFMKQIIDDFFYRFARVEENDDFKDIIAQWLNRVPFTSKVDIKELLENFVKRLKPLIVNLEEMKAEVKEMLQELPVANKNIIKLAEELANDLTDIAAKKTEENKELCTDSINKELEGQIMDWIDNVPELSSDIKENKDMVRNLAKNLKKVLNLDLDDEEREAQMKEETVNWINLILKSKGQKMDAETKAKLSNKLINKLTSADFESNRKNRLSLLGKQNDYKEPISNLMHEKNFEQAVLSEISDLFEDIPNVSESKREQIKDKVAKILSNNIDHLCGENGNIHREIVNILKKEANMPNNEAVNFASTLINRVKEMPSLDQSKSPVSWSTKTDDDIKQLVSNEVCEILNDYNISEKIKKEVEKSIEEVLADQVMRGTNGKITKDKTVSILEDANVSEDDANDISNKLLERNRDLSFSYSTQGSKSLSPMQRGIFQEKAEREILDFIEDLTGDDSLQTRQQRSKQVKNLVHKLGELMSDPNETDKAESIMKQVTPYLQVILKDFDVPIEEAAKKLAKRLQGIEIQTSTPKRESASFYPRRDLSNISSIRINAYDSVQKLTKPAQESSDEVKQYVNKLTDLISAWMDELPVDLSATEDKGFKETMTNDLVGDIIDRLKYLQLNSDAKTSDSDDIEHLKYQVFRWLNKLPYIYDISPIMQKTEALMSKIKEINVPKFVKLPGKRTDIDTDYKTIQGLTPDSMDSIKEIISEWLHKTFANLNVPKPTDINFLTQMINQLAEKIQQYRNENQLNNISKEITDWLFQLLKDVDKVELTKMSETLKTRLEEEFANDSLLSQNKSQFVKENLEGGIQNFVQSLPLYLKRNEEEKQDLERIIRELVEGLKSVLEDSQASTSTDTLLKEEIIKHVQKFPMDVDLKLDQEFIQKISDILLQVIKDMQLFQNISERQDIPPDKYLTAVLEDWFKSLLTLNKNSTEPTKINENLKKEFTEKLKKIRQKDPKEDQKLKDAIKDYLLKFMDNSLKQNQAFIQDKVEELFKNLLAVPIDNTVTHVSYKFVEDAIGNLIKLLPLEKGKTVEDIPKYAVEELCSAVTDVLGKTDNMIQIGDFKKIFESELEKFLKQVPLDGNVTIDLKSLMETLYNDVEKISKNVSDTESVKKRSTVKKAADVLFDNIESWCDDLPITADTPEEVEKVKKVKQEIASKLIHKIGELNMNPEVFNDDFLYYDMLEDEIDNLLTDLSSEDIKNNLPALTKDLMEKLKEVRQKTQEEAAGQNYKQRLRSEISKTFLSNGQIPEAEKADFEILKDNLADAFINLHYVGGNEELKNKYKEKIFDGVDKFCNDYLNKHPESPTDTKKLNQDLYKALKSVPVPKEDSLRDEVELVKIKEVINEWLKELPVKKTPEERMQVNKMIAVLAKKICGIEKQSEQELEPSADYDDKIRKEIEKWVKKPLFNIDDSKTSQLIEKLLDKLKNTKKSRRVSASTRHSIESDLFDYKPSVESSKTSQITQYTIPPTTLSVEDQTHLQELKKRSSPPRAIFPPSKDASVSPLPVDVGSQTEVRPGVCQPTCGRRLSKQSSGVQTQKPPEEKAMQAVGSQAEVTPHVIIREYYWDTLDGSQMAGVLSPCQFPTPPLSPQIGHPRPMAPCPFQLAASESMTPQKAGYPRQMASTPSQATPEVSSPMAEPQGFIAPQTQAQRPMSQQPSSCSRYPCLSPQSSVPDSQTPTPQPPRRPRKEWPPRSRREMPEISSEDQPEPSTSRPCRTHKPRVTRLGSFDNIHPKSTLSRTEWKFPEEDEFWGDKRRLVTDEDGPFLKEQKKEKEKSTCRCREMIVTKCSGRRRGKGCHASGQSTDEVKMCSKCCGVHCPHPSYMYFRQ